MVSHIEVMKHGKREFRKTCLRHHIVACVVHDRGITTKWLPSGAEVCLLYTFIDSKTVYRMFMYDGTLCYYGIIGKRDAIQ